MEMLFQDFDLQVHEDILLMYHGLLLMYQYDQLNVEIPYVKKNEKKMRIFIISYLHIKWWSSFTKC